MVTKGIERVVRTGDKFQVWNGYELRDMRPDEAGTYRIESWEEAQELGWTREAWGQGGWIMYLAPDTEWADC